MQTGMHCCGAKGKYDLRTLSGAGPGSVFIKSSHDEHKEDTFCGYLVSCEADIQNFSYSYCRLVNWSAAPSNHKPAPSGAGFLLRCKMYGNGYDSCW